MIPEFGHFALILAFCISIVQGVLPLAGAHRRDAAWIALAQYDPLLDEGLAYADRLRHAGVPVACTVFEGMIHAFFQHGGFVPAARRAHAAAGAALRAAFGVEE